MAEIPRATVIALCFNHARFVVECLESIRHQTCQSFDLIVTDDCSTDNSPEIIAGWLATHRPEATFIRHERNAGLCRTLNEAVALAKGPFISMIATDDVWEIDKLERQLAVMEQQAADVAVVYSDAIQIDVSGHRLPEDFIESHAPGNARPSGRIFHALADRNFIPAMATVVRAQAIRAVGGYDERLTFEDYDMWLRLAARYRFVFCSGKVARYRIVPNSLARTLFPEPTPDHRYSMFLIRGKWVTSPLLTPHQRSIWKKEFVGAAYDLYVKDDPRARAAMWRAFLRTSKPRALVVALAATIGISRRHAERLRGVLRAYRFRK